LMPSEAVMKYVVIYETAHDADGKLAEHFPAHRALWSEYVADGTLVAIGPFADRSGAMGVFTTRESAESFARNDPFVLHGAIKSWTVREWNEALL
jgi:uncharacterized protein